MKQPKQQPQRYRNLFEEIDRLRPRRILEIGTCGGRHAEQMIHAAAKHHPAHEIEYFGFDLFEAAPSHEYTGRTVPPSMQSVHNRLAATGAKIRLVQGDTKLTLRALAGTAPVDLVFIDGGHSVETIRSDWENVQAVMGRRTVVVFDDYWNYKAGGCNEIVDGLSLDDFRVEKLEPVDEFPRSYGSLRTQFVRVTRSERPGSLTVITFKFTQPRKWVQLKYDTYRAEHVNALWRGAKENINLDHRFLCLTDDPEGVECETAEVWPAIHVNGEDACYRRLRAFDSKWQSEIGTEFILCLDLDAVFLGDVTQIIADAMRNDFTILRGSAWPNGTLCSFYNGSMWMCRAGARPQFWTDFNSETFYQQRNAYLMPGGRRPHGSDQAWFSVRSENREATWGDEHGVVQYRTVKGPVPENAKMLFFAGKQKPWSEEVQRDHPEVYEAWQRYNAHGR